MSRFVGKYVHERHENLDEYYKAVGIPFLPRKMLLVSKPSLELSVDENNQWTITTSTVFRTSVLRFGLGEEYEEQMPGGVLKNKTTLEDDKLITVSVGPNGDIVTRTYEFNGSHFVLTLKHEKSGIEAKKYKRL